jgi:hypothetical protein
VEKMITALSVLILVIWLSPFCRVSADAREPDWVRANWTRP